MILTREFRFEASHQLPWHDGKCARLHGHSWKLTVAVEGFKQPDDALYIRTRGMVADYADLKYAVQPIIDQCLDHYHLNDILQNPTSENLIIWIASKLPDWFQWVQLELNETCTSSCILTPEDYKENYATAQEAKDQAPEETPGRPQGTKDAESQTSQEVSDDDMPF